MPSRQPDSPVRKWRNPQNRSRRPTRPCRKNKCSGRPGRVRVATRIRASCADCGDVELRVDDVQVRVCAEDNAGSYVFRCPSCDMAVVKDAEPRVVDLLLASGVTMTTWTRPAELDEARPTAPAFTHDDLLDFHRHPGAGRLVRPAPRALGRQRPRLHDSATADDLTSGRLRARSVRSNPPVHSAACSTSAAWS